MTHDREKPFREPSKLKAVLLFLFRRDSFIEMSLKHDIAYSLSDNEKITAHYLKHGHHPEEEGIRNSAAARADEMRASLLAAGALVASAAIIGLLVGLALHRHIGDIPTVLNAALQVLGAGTILWATIWELGWDLQTMGRESLGERVHRWVFRSLYTVGTFFFVLAYSWAA